MRHTILALIALGLAGPALAGDLTVEVRDLAGRPVRDAVVMVRPTSGVPVGRPMKMSGPLVMATP